MSITLYGISNCDTVKKARNWLDSNATTYTFHDFRKDGIDNKLVSRILDQVDVDVLVNKRGLSWRQLDDSQKQLGDKNAVIELLVNVPTLIKRPVLAINGEYVIGFNEKDYAVLQFD